MKLILIILKANIIIVLINISMTMNTLNFTLRRLTMLLIALTATTSISWAGTFDTPRVFDEMGVEETAPMLKSGGSDTSFNLGPCLVGDVNNDGEINIADVTILISAVLAHGRVGPGADVNGDGSVDIADVTALITRVLAHVTETRLSVTELAYAMNEVYRSMRTAAWTTTGNTHQCFGITAYTLTGEVMGDDMIMGAMGSGWFWFDAGYNVKPRYTSTTWRSHDLWTAYYTWIAEANSIISQKSAIDGDADLIDYYVGQAYALRAYSYFMLAQWFARTYKGHESDPCVPIFNGTTWGGSTGELRSTVAQVYAQIDADMVQAISLLNGKPQLAPEHIGYAVAQGLRSRIYLVEENWTNAYLAARAAITAFEGDDSGIQNVSDFMGMNDVTAGNVMWGVDIPESESTRYASLFTHMSSNGAYGITAPKEISKWLYNKMSDTDTRRAWWKPNNSNYGTDAYVQQKFDYVEGTEWEGDYIYMRVEEMYLNAAEALAHRGGIDATARTYLNQFMAKRDPNYSCNKTGNELGELTHEETGSLLEEILIQRRLELWGEDCRIHTIRRLHQGFERNADDGWPAGLLLASRSLSDPESYPWVMTIPQSEFYNYYARLILDADQNPIGDYYVAPTDLEREPQHITFKNASQHYYVPAQTSVSIAIPMLRPSTSSKPYEALLMLKDSNGNTKDWTYVYFAANQFSANADLHFSSFPLDEQYVYTLSLTDLEMSSSTSSQQTTTQIIIDSKNINPEGQHISFEAPTQEIVSTDETSTAEVPVTLTRALTTEYYTARVSMSDADENVQLMNEYVYFVPGQSTATTTVRITGIEPRGTYSFTLTLSDADVATADPNLGEQITSTTITYHSDAPLWVSAGTCTFTDYTWENGTYAPNVPIQQAEGTNMYRIISPLYYVYRNSMDDPSRANWIFEMNEGGAISPLEGNWDLAYWQYPCYYNSTNYPQYCYVVQDGNTYSVHFILLLDGTPAYTGDFKFTWDR